LLLEAKSSQAFFPAQLIIQVIFSLLSASSQCPLFLARPVGLGVEGPWTFFSMASA
jgi:hypothetical protein